MNKSHILWDDSVATVINPTPLVKKNLTITESEIVQDPKKPWIRKVQRKKVKLYDEINANGLHGLITLQGFHKRIEASLLADGVPYQKYDERRDFPKPQFDLMRDLRFSQGALLRQGLEADCSCLIGAPTRYGKTFLLINTIRAFPDRRIAVVIPGIDLLKQTHKKICDMVPGRQIKLVGGGSSAKQATDHGGITVVSIDSLHKLDPKSVDLILGDEPHSLISKSRMEKWKPFEDIRRIAFGATLKGRFDGRDNLMEGLFGPVTAERTYLEAVEEGAICPLTVMFMDVEVDPGQWYGPPPKDRDAAYNALLYLNKDRMLDIRNICQQVIPQDWQTIIFVSHERQADMMLAEAFKGDNATIAMAKKLNKKGREDLFSRMESGEVKRALATNIYAQGVTFSDLRFMINAEGGGANTSAIQKPGRLAEVVEGKKYGLIVDFMFRVKSYPQDPSSTFDKEPPESWTKVANAFSPLARDSAARMKAYTEKGYEVLTARTLEDLKLMVGNRV